MGNKSDSRVSFDDHYAAIYAERWPSLRTHLMQELPKIWRINRNAFGFDSSVWSRANRDFDWAVDCVRDPEGLLAANHTLADKGLEPLYKMDLASVVVARALEVGDGMNVVDLCAAPGGKLLVLAESIGRGGQLVANELSRSRRFKMLAVMEQFLPSDQRHRISVSGWDAAKVGVHQEERFDRVLVDAPCSAEAHLLHRNTELERWTPSRTRQLARRQYAILCSALLAARSGGRIVYATCSLSPVENDGVIQRLIKRKGEQVRILDYDSPLGQRTEFGWQILPDHDDAGPAYFSVIEKRTLAP